MTPTSGVVPKRGREILTAILAACPSGLALHEAYHHHLEVWRESEEGQEIIHDFDDGRYEDWFLRFLSGRFEDSSRDPFLFLYKTMNLAELSASRNLDDFSDTDGSGDDEDSDDQVLLESADEQAAKQAAEAELKKLGSDELLDQAAETAARVAKQARDAQVSDEQIYFNTAQGRLEMGEGSCGADPRGQPSWIFPRRWRIGSSVRHRPLAGPRRQEQPAARCASFHRPGARLRRHQRHRCPHGVWRLG